MLHIYFDDIDSLRSLDSFIWNPSLFFDILYREKGEKEGWLQDRVVREIIETVDRVPLCDNTKFSLFEHGMRPEDLCTGTKNLILCKFHNGINRISSMGPNCYPFLERIASEQEVYVGCSIVFDLSEDFFSKSSVHILNDDTICSSFTEWQDHPKWIKYIYCKESFK